MALLIDKLPNFCPITKSKGSTSGQRERSFKRGCVGWGEQTVSDAFWLPEEIQKPEYKCKIQIQIQIQNTITK